MQKVTLSALAALMVSSAVYADTMTLYTDPATGQVFTTPAEGRVEMGDFIDAKTVYLENQEQDSAIAKEKSKDKSVKTFAKASKLEFSGTHYLGAVYTDNANGDQSNKFETRRNYLQVKAFMFDNPKSYMRVTLDTKQDDDIDGGSWVVRLKYAFLYLDSILPYTGVEMGQVHRPWIDYEEHNAWWYRSISKVFVEASESAHLTNSADLGVNFKTKTPYFTSEIGVFNGEGYHAIEDGNGFSVEWRATAAMLGNGEEKRKPTTSTYWDASFFGQYNMENTKNNDETYAIYGLHTVYNQPEFLLSAQYVIADNDAADTAVVSDWNGNGFSAGATYRFGDEYKWELLGRYDNWTAEDKVVLGDEIERTYWIAGVGYQYNKNVKFIVNMLNTDPNTDVDDDEHIDVMATAEVHW